jgi:ketosteroid isomerase-like protein
VRLVADPGIEGEPIELERAWMEAVGERDLGFLEGVLAAEFTLTTGGQDRTTTYLMTDVFVRQDGRWKAIARHTSPLEGPPGRALSSEPLP